MKQKIGLLIPRSAIYQGMSFDLMDGLKEGLKAQGLEDTEIKTAGIGVAGDYNAVYAQCEQLLFDGVDVIIGYLNPRVAPKLEGLFANAGKILIILDAGYHYSTEERHSNIFYISLQSILCHRVIAASAVKNGHAQAVLTGSYFDAGFNGGFAFAQGLEDAGGRISFNHVTKLKRSEFNLDDLMVHLKENKNEAVLASFCGDMMLDFCEHVAKDKLYEYAGIYCPAFAADEQWLDKTPYCETDIDTCVAWARGLENEQNLKFKESLKVKGRVASLFSLLTWEAASLCKVISDAGTTAEAITALEGFTYDSPRGKVQISADTHQTYAPVYKAKIISAGNSFSALQVLGLADDIEIQRQMIKRDYELIKNGGTYWFNAYACLDS